MKTLLTTLLSFVLLSCAYSQNILDFVRNGDLKEVKRWFEKTKRLDIDFMSVNVDFDTIYTDPMSYACSYGQMEIVEYFIANEPRIPRYDVWLGRALGGAVLNGDYELTQRLIEEGADINFPCPLYQDMNPIHIALAQGEEKIFRLLRAYGADVGLDYTAETMNTAVIGADMITIKEFVEEDHLDVNSISTEGYSPLYHAVQAGRKDVAKYLVEKGADITFKSTFEETLMHAAVQSGDIPTAEWVVELLGKEKAFGRNINAPILHEAVITDNADMAEYLIKAGVRKDETNKDGQTALFMIFRAWEQRAELMHVLLKNGLDINHRDHYKKSIEDLSRDFRDKYMLKLVQYFKENPPM